VLTALQPLTFAWKVPEKKVPGAVFASSWSVLFIIFQVLDFFANPAKGIFGLLAGDTQLNVNGFPWTSLEAATIFVELVAIHDVAYLWVVNEHEVAVNVAVVGGENSLPDS
jgi:hypothetical protein